MISDEVLKELCDSYLKMQIVLTNKRLFRCLNKEYCQLETKKQIKELLASVPGTSMDPRPHRLEQTVPGPEVPIPVPPIPVPARPNPVPPIPVPPRSRTATQCPLFHNQTVKGAEHGQERETPSLTEELESRNVRLTTWNVPRINGWTTCADVKQAEQIRNGRKTTNTDV